MGGVQVRMANATGFNLDKHLPGTRSRHGNFLDLQRLAERTHYCRFHCFAHRLPLINGWLKQLHLSRGALWMQLESSDRRASCLCRDELRRPSGGLDI
jgi:hypothetical protein